MPLIARLALLVPSAMAGVSLYAFAHSQVAPCTALYPASNDACVEAWRASRPWFEQLLDTPVPGLTLAIALAAATLLMTRNKHTTAP